MSVYSRDTTTAAQTRNSQSTSSRPHRSDRTACDGAKEHNRITIPSSEVATPKDLDNSRSNQLTPDGHNATASPILYPNEYNQYYVDPVVFEPSSSWEYTSTPSIFGEESTNGTFAAQKHELNELGSQSQVVSSYFRVPQISWDTNWGPPLSFDDQATMPVSTTNPMYLQLAWKLKIP